MVDLVLGNEIDVEIEIPAVPSMLVDPMSIDTVMAPPAIEVQIEIPQAPVMRMAPPSPPDVMVVPVPGVKGDKGDKGEDGIDGGGSGVQEIFVQNDEPTQGANPWFLAQTDVDGDVEFLKVYEP